MNGSATRLIRFSAALVGLFTLAWALASQAAKPVLGGIPLPTDWSHRHVIFSQPGTAQERALVESDPRYWQQLYRRGLRLVLPDNSSDGPGSNVLRARSAESTKELTGLWEENLGTGATVGAENFPAKFSFRTTSASCGSDFVVFSTGLNGTASQANLVAYNNLYSGCGGTVPSVYWAYNISDALLLGSGQILTSPVFSLDGSQIAFVQHSGASFHGTLVLLKWAASTTETVTGPGTPASVTPAMYRTCTAPCMTTIALRSGTNTATDDTTSSVFYDYTNDIAWVGDSQGWIHKFTGVFKGLVPAEVRSGGFPVHLTVGSNIALSSPVYDRVLNRVFIGDYGGFLYRVDAATAAVTRSGQLDFGAGIVAGPVVDATRGFVYVAASSDGTGGCGGGTACARVYQLSTNFAAGNKGTKVKVGVSTVVGVATPNPMYDGYFDETYINSANGTGNLYICGNTGANPILYQVPIAAGVFGAAATISTLGTAGSTPACSPVTDVFTPGATPASAATERLFVSVSGNSSAATCGGGGCIQNLIDTPWQASKSFPVGQEILVKSNLAASRFINVVITAGTSGALQPTWPNTTGTTTPDGGVTWLSQGNPNTAIGGWTPNHLYNVVGTRILDNKGNVEIVQVAGTSGLTTPAWATTAGLTTTDKTVTWINAGAWPSSALAATGGTSGIIIDNTVAPGALGTSQVYFSTQGDQVCGASGTGGCAVQASQSTLK